MKDNMQVMQVSKAGAVLSIGAIVIMFILSLVDYIIQFTYMTDPFQKTVSIAGYAAICYLVYVIPVKVLYLHLKQR